MSEPNHLYHQALSSNRKLLEENARLKAEVDRLRKAGDAMHKVIGYELRTDRHIYAWHDWNAAKEGKPSV